MAPSAVDGRLRARQERKPLDLFRVVDHAERHAAAGNRLQFGAGLRDAVKIHATGGKSAAPIVVDPFSRNVISTTSAPAATPVDNA